MTLIISKNLEVMPMTLLMQNALQFVYEREKMPVQQARWLFESLDRWTKFLAYRAPEELNAIETEYLHTLQDVAKLLQDDDEGKFDARKKNFKYHGIDWRKFHHLPGAVTDADRARAAKMKAEYDQKNPEQESVGNIDAGLDFLNRRKGT